MCTKNLIESFEFNQDNIANSTGSIEGSCHFSLPYELELLCYYTIERLFFSSRYIFNSVFRV